MKNKKSNIPFNRFFLQLLCNDIDEEKAGAFMIMASALFRLIRRRA